MDWKSNSALVPHSGQLLTLLTLEQSKLFWMDVGYCLILQVSLISYFNVRLKAKVPLENLHTKSEIYSICIESFSSFAKESLSEHSNEDPFNHESRNCLKRGDPNL